MIELSVKLQEEAEQYFKENWHYDLKVFVDYSFHYYYVTVLHSSKIISLEDDLNFYKLTNEFEDKYPELELEFTKFTYDEWKEMYEEE